MHVFEVYEGMRHGKAFLYAYGEDGDENADFTHMEKRPAIFEAFVVRHADVRRHARPR
jgi:hypothetical protein